MPTGGADSDDLPANDGTTSSFAGRKRLRLAPGDRRDHLIRTAITIFAERGTEATSVLQITQAAGVSNGTFYHYFANKDELIEAVSALVVAELRQSLAQFRSDASNREKIAIGTIGAMRAVGSNAELGSILAEYFERNADVLQSAAAALGDVIRQGGESGEFPVHTPAQQILGMFEAMLGVAARAILTGLDPGDVGEFVAAAQLRMLGVDNRRAAAVAAKVRRQMARWTPAITAQPDPMAPAGTDESTGNVTS